MFTNNTFNEYLWSSFITFVAAFATAIIPTLGSLPFQESAIVALGAVGVRAGVRAVINLISTGFSTTSSKPL